MKIVTVIGARPQFIKSAPVSKAIQNAGFQEYLVHTGQHYDYGMSEIFFKELGIHEPYINLNVGSGTHAQQTSQMLVGIESFLLEYKPDIVLVYGDTNSTLAGALAAAKLQVKIAHIEAGLRSYNRQMPEEHNRVLADHCSDLLFCPTQTACNNLIREGILSGIYMVGDTMYDAILQFLNVAARQSEILITLKLKSKEYLLSTIHRAYNTDDPDAMSSIMSAFQQVGENIIFPIHPRTARAIKSSNIKIPRNVKLIEPVGYLDMLMLEQNARMILTDSGGIQKEAYFLAVPCVTLRPETEWVETVETGWNVLTGPNTELITSTVMHHLWPDTPPAKLFGDGKAAQNILARINKYLN